MSIVLDPPEGLAPVDFLECEITTKCRLRCGHCYNSSGADGDHGPITLA